MRHTKQELLSLSSQVTDNFDREGVLILKEQDCDDGFISRWFRLRGNLLFYLKGPDPWYEPLGVIVLGNHKVFEQDQDENGHWPFQLVWDNGVRYCMGTFLKSDRTLWLEAMANAPFETLTQSITELNQQLKDRGTMMDLKKYRTTNKVINDINDVPICELALACDKLPCAPNGNPPSPFATVFALFNNKDQCVRYGCTEVVEKSRDPFFYRTIMFRGNDGITFDMMIRIVVYDMRDINSQTGVIIGSVVMRMSYIQEALKLRVPLLTAENKVVGYVTLDSWNGVPPESYSHPPNPQTTCLDSNPAVPVHRRSESLPLWKRRPLQILRYPACSLLVRQCFVNPIQATYRFHSDVDADIIAHEVLVEPGFCFTMPLQLVDIFLTREQEIKASLEGFTEGEDHLQLHSAVIAELLAAKSEMLKHSVFFKPSIKKVDEIPEEAGLAYVPVNLHLQRMWAHNDMLKKSQYHDIITVGAFTAHARAAPKPGGLIKLLQQSKEMAARTAEINASSVILDAEFEKLRIMNNILNIVITHMDAALLLLYKGLHADMRKSVTGIRENVKLILDLWNIEATEEALSKIGWQKKRIDEEDAEARRADDIALQIRLKDGSYRSASANAAISTVAALIAPCLVHTGEITTSLEAVVSGGDEVKTAAGVARDIAVAQSVKKPVQPDPNPVRVQKAKKKRTAVKPPFAQTDSVKLADTAPDNTKIADTPAEAAKLAVTPSETAKLPATAPETSSITLEVTTTDVSEPATTNSDRAGEIAPTAPETSSLTLEVTTKDFSKLAPINLGRADVIARVRRPLKKTRAGTRSHSEVDLGSFDRECKRMIALSNWRASSENELNIVRTDGGVTIPGEAAGTSGPSAAVLVHQEGENSRGLSAAENKSDIDHEKVENGRGLSAAENISDIDHEKVENGRGLSAAENISDIDHEKVENGRGLSAAENITDIDHEKVENGRGLSAAENISDIDHEKVENGRGLSAAENISDIDHEKVENGRGLSAAENISDIDHEKEENSRGLSAAENISDIDHHKNKNGIWLRAVETISDIVHDNHENKRGLSAKQKHPKKTAGNKENMQANKQQAGCSGLSVAGPSRKATSTVVALRDVAGSSGSTARLHTDGNSNRGKPRGTKHNRPPKQTKKACKEALRLARGEQGQGAEVAILGRQAKLQQEAAYRLLFSHGDSKKGRKNRENPKVTIINDDPAEREYNLNFFKTLKDTVGDLMGKLFVSINTIKVKGFYTACEFEDTRIYMDLVLKMLDEILKWNRMAHNANRIHRHPISSMVEYTMLRTRRDICFSQALTTAAAGVLSWVTSKPVYVVGKIMQSGLGPLLGFEGLLSMYNEEITMWGDMVVAVEDLQNLTFTFVPVTTNSAVIPQVTGSRRSLVIEIPIVATLYDELVNLNTPMSFKVTSVFFNVGINGKASVAEALGDTKLQNQSNKDNFQRLHKYYLKYCNIFPQNTFEQTLSALSRCKSLDQAMDDLRAAVHRRTSKNVELLHLAALATRLMHGVRFTSCKSAKDRTGMAVTLEQATILSEEYHMNDRELKPARDVMRSEGCRRENTMKNIGQMKYAFTRMQVQALPEEYRPPLGSYGDVRGSNRT